MICFFVSTEANAEEANLWSQAIKDEGIRSVHWTILPDVKMETTGPVECPHDPYDIAAFEIFRLETQAAYDQNYRYGHTPDEILNSAPYWYRNAAIQLDNLKKEYPVAFLVVRGSSTLSRRAAILAAEDLGIKVFCIEDGLFQLPDIHTGARPAILLTEDRAYYDKAPKEWCERVDTIDGKRWAGYREWWLSKRRTKYTGSKPHQELLAAGDVGLPLDFVAAERRVVWFGQLQGDASLFWNAPIDLPEDVWQRDVWYKPHPFGIKDYSIWSRKNDRWVDKRASVHQVLPLCDVVAGITTNVCLEAWMYRRRVAVYGNPFYARFGCVSNHINDTTPIDQDARDAYLDWFIHEVQVPNDDGPRFIRRLNGEVA